MKGRVKPWFMVSYPHPERIPWRFAGWPALHQPPQPPLGAASGVGAACVSSSSMYPSA